MTGHGQTSPANELFHNLHTIMLEQVEIASYDDLVKMITGQLMRIFKPVGCTFSKYDPEKKALQMLDIKTGPGVLDLGLKLGVFGFLSKPIPLDERDYKQIMQERIFPCATLYEATNGFVPQYISTLVGKTLQISCYLGIFFVVDNEVFGNSVLALKAEPDPALIDHFKTYIAFTSITIKRLLAEEALRKSETEHRTLLDSAPDTIARFDRSLRHVFINRKATEELGLPVEHFIGKTNRELGMPGEVIEIWEAGLLAAFREAKEQVVDIDIETAHGFKHYTSRIVPEFAQSGKVDTVLSITRDISERKLAMKRLEEEFNLRNALLDNIPNCVALILKKDTREIVASNRAGYEIGAVPGKTCFQTSALRDDPCPFCLAPEMWRSGRLQQLEIKYRGIWYTGIWAPLPNDLYVHYIFDITARKKTEEALELQARERAAVDTFTYSVSNDLQAPLRRIEGFSEMLLEECPDDLNERARDYLRRIVTQINSMQALTDALLQLSKVVSREIALETVNLSALVRSTLEKLQYKDPERRVETIVTPELIAEGDADLLSIMLNNLVDNAWKFTSGKEKARIEFGSTVQEEKEVFFLRDNGVGFAIKDTDKLFAPFHKLHSDEDYPGIGIGLNLAFRIISRHGGEIWAEGEVEKGACFYFTLP